MAHTRFGGRTLARSQALQLLFQAQATGRLVSDVLAGDYTIDEGPLDSYAVELAQGADGMLHELDLVIGDASTNWSVSRMPTVDRNLLRLAVYEMAVVDEVDVPISIDEFVELAKAYGTDESSKFVNGILGRIAKMLDEDDDLLADAAERVAEGEAQQDDGFEEYVPDDYDYADDDSDDVPAWVEE